MTDRARKFTLGLFAGLTVVLAGATAAYACVPFRGNAQVNVSGGATPQNSGTVTGDGGNDPLQYCGNTDLTPQPPGYTSVTEAQADRGALITVSVAAASSCNDFGDNKLPQGNQTVILNNAKTASATPFTFVANGTLGNVWSIVKTTGCFTSATPTGNITLDTAFSVDANGAGTKTYSLSTLNRIDGTNAASALCVGTPTVGTTIGRAIFVPLKVEAII